MDAIGFGKQTDSKGVWSILQFKKCTVRLLDGGQTYTLKKEAEQQAQNEVLGA